MANAVHGRPGRETPQPIDPDPWTMSAVLRSVQLPSWHGPAIWMLVLGILSLVALGYDLRSEPHWIDESAFISQSSSSTC